MRWWIQKKKKKGPMIFKMDPLFEILWVPGTYFHEFSTTALFENDLIRKLAGSQDTKPCATGKLNMIYSYFHKEIRVCKSKH